MVRLLFAISFLFGFGLLGAESPVRRPNVIFIITDDQKRDDVGFLTGKALTPNLDRIAKQGVRFENSYTCSTVCTPSRYACITGRFPSRCTSPSFLGDITPERVTKVYFNTHLEPDRPNLPKALQAAGYTTGLVGKWHLGLQGFRRGNVPANADPKDPAIRAELEREQRDLCEELKVHGFDEVSRIYAGNPLDSVSLRNAGLAHHNMEWVTEGAVDFIDAHHDKPFFLYFSTTLPHAPDPVGGMREDPRSTPVGFLDEPPASGMPAREKIFRTVAEAGLAEKTAGNTWLDAGVGAILARLEKHGIADDTLIIYFNDHGMEHSSKSTLYQGALRTPSAARWPRRIRPQVCGKLVSNVDITPTILDACGVPPLPEMILDGRSYLPVLEDPAAVWREAIYAEIGFTRAVVTEERKYLAFRLPPSQVPDENEGMRQQFAMLEEIKRRHPWVDWKPDPDAKVPHVGGPPGGDFLVRLTLHASPPYKKNYFDPDQLYELGADPLETTNLASDPAHAERLAAMQGRLGEFLKELPGEFGEWNGLPVDPGH
ncbi:hypothetical protein HAHE_01260 [Haloferula helveola]|uniref:Sulfatase N-terminal domain-containing protein n=1 Tax=Haloferula helveola TaxID=490095 RepID=A0ABN6GY92_9BACT|nr:hypothetical protein HAHE_01260 [Haloferula helveola]